MYCFFDENQKREAINISPGEYFLSGRGMLIHTLLGTGVSVALYDPVLKTGGMNHFIVSEKRSSRNAAAQDGINFTETLIDSFLKNGSDKSNLQAKILGGSVFSDEQEINEAAAENVRLIEVFLTSNNIEILSRNTGGNEVRKIYFYTDTFKILFKKLNYEDTEINKQMIEYHHRNKHGLSKSHRKR